MGRHLADRRQLFFRLQARARVRDADPGRHGPRRFRGVTGQHHDPSDSSLPQAAHRRRRFRPNGILEHQHPGQMRVHTD
jgi:hypothetical protein